ncbi:MAG: alpha/beta fold hydrolase [Fimbriimonas sp.]
MSTVLERNDFSWIDKRVFPFEPNYLDVDGGQMHYVDTQGGRPIVFVHGWPTWSFSFRGVIRMLMKDFRCIAPDLIGFGRSAKPENWRYSPGAHSQNLEALINHLDLQDVTLVLHDFGGPVGLSYALENLDRVSRIVLMNTWMWDISDDPVATRPAKLAQGPLGRMAYIKMNAAPKAIKSMFCDRDKYTDTVHEGYFGPFHRQEDRFGAFAVAKQLTEGSGWFADIWSNRHFLNGLPLQLVWGTQDNAFGEKAMNRIWHEFPLCDVKQFEDSGRFVMEEHPQAVAEAIRSFMLAKHQAGYVA